MTVPTTRLQVSSENGVLTSVSLNNVELTTATHLILDVEAGDMPRAKISFDVYDAIIDVDVEVVPDITDLRQFIKESMQDTLQEETLADWVAEDIAQALFTKYITPYLTPTADDYGQAS